MEAVIFCTIIASRCYMCFIRSLVSRGEAFHQMQALLVSKSYEIFKICAIPTSPGPILQRPYRPRILPSAHCNAAGAVGTVTSAFLSANALSHTVKFKILDKDIEAIKAFVKSALIASDAEYFYWPVTADITIANGSPMKEDQSLAAVALSRYKQFVLLEEGYNFGSPRKQRKLAV
jgi:hypothetical protein